MISIVVPTLGRPSLAALLDALAGQLGDAARVELLLVDDRPDDTGELAVPGALAAYTKVADAGAARARRRPATWAGGRPGASVGRLPGRRRGARAGLVPAARRRPGGCGRRVGGSRRAASQVPLPADRRPTDWERGTAGLADGQLDHRRHGLPARGAGRRRAASTSAFRAPSGRTPTSALRRPARRLRWSAGSAASPTRYARAAAGSACACRRGNADDALMRRLYGRGWRRGPERPRAGGRGTWRSPRPPPWRGGRGCAGRAGVGGAAAALAAARLAGRHRRVRLGPDRARAAHRRRGRHHGW